MKVKKKMKLETARRNFKKDGVIYGVLEKDFNIVKLIRFDDWNEAKIWISKPDVYDFRTKRFLNERKGEKLEEEGYNAIDCDIFRKEREMEEKFLEWLINEEEKESRAFYNSFLD